MIHLINIKRHFKWILFLWFVKTAIFSFMLWSSLFLSWCDSVLAWIGQKMCDLAPDSDHCFQRSAVQWWDTSTCDKIKWTKFKSMWSNPPRDKCYLTIAENKWDPAPCKKIQGWLMSYTQDECYKWASKKALDDAITKDDPVWCKKLASFPAWYQWNYEVCKQQLCNPEKLKNIDWKIDEIEQRVKDGDKSAKKELAKLNTDKQARYEQMSSTDKANYFQSKREALVADIEDEDVKSAIAKDYTSWRNSTSPTNINKMTDKLADIVEKQKVAKALDDQANETLDNIKNQMVEFVEKQKDDAIDEVLWKWQEAAEERIKKNGGDDLNTALLKTKRAAEKYDKASKEYEWLMKQYNKIKWMYDEVMGTYKRMDDISSMVAKGKINEWQAKVVKWAVLLDKWLEYTTAYVPVFGSTISKVSKETFGVVIDLAKKRAERSNELDKCFSDPLNCNYDAISAY